MAEQELVTRMEFIQRTGTSEVIWRSWVASYSKKQPLFPKPCGSKRVDNGISNQNYPAYAESQLLDWLDRYNELAAETGKPIYKYRKKPKRSLSFLFLTGQLTKVTQHGATL